MSKTIAKQAGRTFDLITGELTLQVLTFDVALDE